MDPEGFVIKEEPEASIYLPGEFYWNWRLHHCPVFHTIVPWDNKKASILKQEIVSPQTHSASYPKLTVSLVRLEESKDPEVRKYLEASLRSPNVLAKRTTVKMEVKNECLDLETLTEENIIDDRECTRYAEPWDSVINPQAKYDSVVVGSKSHFPVESKSTNARQRSSNFSGESTSVTENITAPSATTEFENFDRDSLTNQNASKVKYSMENLGSLAKRKAKLQCDNCNRYFDRKYRLMRHMKRHIENRLECYGCNKAFLHKNSFNRHMMIHTGNKSHKCHICEKTFLQKSHLNSHMRTHTREKPHKCHICEKTFAQKGTLNNHIRIHTGEKPHKCHICERRFTRHPTLKLHMLIHTGEKPYKCQNCEKKFTYKSNLNSHMLVHFDELAHACPNCKKSFTHKKGYRNHMLIHCGEGKYTCYTCERSFLLKSHVRRHLLTYNH